MSGASESYAKAAAQPNCSDWMRKRAELNAGEMLDLLHQRAAAVQQYQMASAAGGDQTESGEARRYLRIPYSGR